MPAFDDCAPKAAVLQFGIFAWINLVIISRRKMVRVS